MKPHSLLVFVLASACVGRQLDATELKARAKSLHREAQKTENLAKYREAHQLYVEYLSRFGDAPDVYNMTFYDAEALFKIGELEAPGRAQDDAFDEAAQLYARVVKMNRDGAFLQDAAYAHVIATKNALSDDEEKPEAQAKLQSAFELYLENVSDSPDNARRVLVEYRQARILYERNQFDEAALLFANIAEHHPEHELAVYSANLLLDCLNARGRINEIRVWVEKLAQSPLIKDPDLAANIAQLRAQLAKTAK